MVISKDKTKLLVLGTVCKELQTVLWDLVEEYATTDPRATDHIFHLSIECACGEVFQKITYRKDHSSFCKIFYYKYIYEAVQTTIWIRDAIDPRTMLIPTDKGKWK
ncbi:DUF960 family protein [Pelosinus sp. sgz500959]|uniref:DUF960 family protein n=1 Tax=Pelosinus sp. sgz500959 TaxID=3242472 RepID=UPI003671B45B